MGLPLASAPPFPAAKLSNRERRTEIDTGRPSSAPPGLTEVVEEELREGEAGALFDIAANGTAAI